jgi:uncharacterized protein DUF5317
MFILYALLAGLVVGLLLGGRPSALAELHFRWAPLIAVGFLLQVALFSDAVASRVGDLGPILYVATTLMVVVAVLRNLELPGIWIVVLGALCNMAAIVSNGGYMPATPEALASLGKSAPTIYSNSAVVASPNLPWLIDRFALPRGVPFANVFSVGDVLLALGIFVLLVVVLRRGRRPAAPVVPSSVETA